MKLALTITICIFLLSVIVLSSICVVFIIKCINRRCNAYNEKAKLFKVQQDQLQYIVKKQQLEYSDQFMAFLKNVIGQIVVIRFRTFKDSRDLEKLTEQQIKNLIVDIAEETNEYLRQSFDFTDKSVMLFNEKFYNVMIVNTIIIMVKELTGKSVDDYADSLDPRLFEQ